VAAKVLVAFHSEEGQTATIADRIAGVLRDRGNHVELAPVEDAPAPPGFDAVVLGDPIYVGRHSRAMVKFLRQHVDTLNRMPSAFFQVSMTSAKADEEHAGVAHGLVDDLLDDTGYDPDLVAMFAGALMYTRYGWIKRHVMHAIAKREGDDTDTTRDYYYTDWGAVDEFAAHIAALLESKAAS
jgi:menaquinone-dependent protoporphyrinogen oxidase